MLANNVQESTTSTGTGSITLAGSSESGRTFASQYPVGCRFPYFIDDGVGSFETGIGYLSDSTTLVREKPQDGSATLPVNFGAGEKQVFAGANTSNLIWTASTAFSSGLGGLNVCKPDSVVSATNRNTTANEIIYIPQLYNREMVIDLLGVTIASGATESNMYAGIYDTDPSTGRPSELLVETTIPTTSTGVVTGSLPSDFTLNAGWHYFAIWCDVGTISLRSSSGTTLISNPYTQSSNGLGNVFIQQGQSGLASLPATAVPTIFSGAGSSFNYLLVGHS